MLRQVSDDLFVVGECVQGEHGHEAVRVYVLKNDDRPIIIDTGSHLHQTKIMDGLDEILDGAEPEAVFLTHTELPHSGNVRTIATRWPNAKPTVADSIIPYIELAPVVEQERITLAPMASVANFAGRTLEFVHAPLKDQPASQWIFDFRTHTLFTADAFGYYHKPGRCDLFADEMEEGIRKEDFLDYHRIAFRYLRWVLPKPLNEALDTVFLRDVSIIAPVHGNPIRTNVRGHLKRLQDAMTQICTESRGSPLQVKS